MTLSEHTLDTASDEITVGHDRIAFKVTSEQTGGELAAFEVKMPPGGGPPMLHRHEAFELYRVRSGELAFYLEGRDGAVRRTVAGPGAVVPIAGGREHTIRNESELPAQALAIFSPGEAMERFVRAAADLGDGDPEEVLALAESHGIEMTRSVEDALAEARPAGYLTIARFTGDGERLLDDYRRYAETMDGVGRDHDLILHAGARTEDGLMVVNLWPSKERSEAAALDARRLAVVEQAEIDPNEVRRDHYELARAVLFD